jgi:hypothetical protein
MRKRWTAAGMLLAEQQFRRIIGYRHLAKLIIAIERHALHVEEKNRDRTKVMGRFPGESSCLTLVWAVLDLLITHQTNGIRFNALDRQRLKRERDTAATNRSCRRR